MEQTINRNKRRDEALSQGYDGHNRKPARVSRKALRHRRFRRRWRTICRGIVRTWLAPTTNNGGVL